MESAPRKRSRVVRWIGRAFIAFVLFTLLTQPWILATYRVTIEVSARIVDAESGRAVEGARVFSVPDPDRMHRPDWAEARVEHEQLLDEQQREFRRSWSSSATSNAEGHAVGRLTPLISYTSWQCIGRLGRTVPHGFKVEGVVVVADGYETKFVASDGIRWERSGRETEDGGRVVEADFGTIALEPTPRSGERRRSAR